MSLRCGYCPEQAIAWMEWKTIGRPKGAPVCAAHWAERDVPDNWGDHPVFLVLKDALVQCGTCFWCLGDRAHPEGAFHSVYHRISDRLLVADSLDPADRVQVWACTTCGHKREGAR